MNDEAHSSQDVKWYCPNYRELLIECWENEYFVFNPNSGDTHVLNVLAADILKALAEEAKSIPDLTGQMRTTGTLDRVSLTESVSVYLKHLDELGLVTPLYRETR